MPEDSDRMVAENSDATSQYVGPNFVEYETDINYVA
jgi:hypothetical protein